MAEYIDRVDVYKKACKGCTRAGDELGTCCAEEPCAELISAFTTVPAADVVEVKHGRWLHVHVAVVDTTGDCSVCNTEAVWRTRKKPYSICPNCGARMGGE